MPSTAAGTTGPALARTNTPVPNVALIVPGRWPPCPARAACWSQAIARSGSPPPQPGWVSRPRSPTVGPTIGRAPLGTAHQPASPSSQASERSPNSWVRDAVDGSVRAGPPRRAVSHASTVPTARRPDRAAAATGSTFSISQRIFEAEKYGSSGSPVRSRIAAPWPAAATRSTIGWLRRQFQRTAGASGSPVTRSQATTVSPWLSSPTAAIRAGPPTAARTSSTTSTTDARIASGSCSAQPGCG